MLIIPLIPDLRIGYKPIITFSTIVLCIVILDFQERSRAAIEQAARSYCAQVHESHQESQSDDWLASDVEECESLLQTVHSFADRDLASHFLEELYAEDPGSVTRAEWERELAVLWQHYDAFGPTAPSSLDAMLNYFPNSPNPIRMLTSSFSHGDWSYVIGNMIFFFAFATALEILIGNALLYLAIIATISVMSGLAYSLYTTLFDLSYPTLGFSDVVMGIIGLSAYLMPRAKIRTLVWVFHWARVSAIPAWLFASWYIGWDTYYLLSEGNESGTNMVSHVAGGFTGYLLGWWWLRDRKWLIREELEDEIDYMRAKRHDQFGVLSSHISKRAFREEQAAEVERQRAKTFDNVLTRVHKLNATAQCSDALTMLLEGIREHGESEDTLRYVFDTIQTWRITLFTLRFARYYIDYLLARGKHKEALNVCDTCYQLAPEFVLEQPLDVIPLAKAAEKQQRYALAYALVHDCEERYGQTLDITGAQLMEARLLACHLDQPEAAHEVIKRLLDAGDPRREADIMALADKIRSSLEHSR